MQPCKLTDHVARIASIDWSRRLFDALIPLPDGTSYNAYLVRSGSKTALIDSTDPSMSARFMAALDSVDSVDYLVANHAEQDHSGTLPLLLERYPGAVLLCTPKCKDMLVDLLCVPAERIRAVEDGESVDLGGLTLEFIHTPWVHWPETMCTYLVQDCALFSCDFFGSHYATTDLYVQESAVVYEAAKRYYAEIMMPFRTIIRKNLAKVKAREVQLIAPSHGPVYADPQFIISAYEDWVSENVKNEVVLPYVSMHGSTAAMVLHLADQLAARGVRVHLFDLSVTDLGKLAIALVDAATLVVGTPTVHVGPHPLVFYAAFLANALRPKLRWTSIVGSYGWSSKAVDRIAELIPNLKVELLDPVICRGYPRARDFDALDALAVAIAEKHGSI
jgi:flavorubredoxin